MTESTPLAFIGGGTMAEAIIRGAIAAKVLDPKHLVVTDPQPDRRAMFTALGVQAAESTPEAIDRLRLIETDPGSGQILLATKPQMLPDVVEQLAPAIEGEHRIVISILAGARSETIRTGLGGNVHVVRVMPNTPARIRQGMAAIALGAGAQPGDDQLAEQVFSAIGRVVRIDESLMDAFTAVAGSGPAYVFYLAEAMAAAAQRIGFDPDQADLIVRQTIAGAGNLMLDSADTPGALRAAVTSKKGTTAAATETLDEMGMTDAMIAAIRAARDRGRELSQP